MAEAHEFGFFGLDCGEEGGDVVDGADAVCVCVGVCMCVGVGE